MSNTKKSKKHAKKKSNNNKKNKLKKTRFNYDKDSLNSAVKEVESGKSIRETARKYQIPESTIRDKKNNRYPDKKPGPPTVLSVVEENELVQWIFYCSAKGFPVTKHQLIDSIQLMCNSDKRKTPFKNNKQGKTWFSSFMYRHPEISQRIAENVSFNRASVSEYRIRSWFAEVDDYFKLKPEKLQQIPPSRIFNSDETGVPLNPPPPAVLAKKGSKNVYNIVGNNEKENVTVLVTGNAEGTLVRTLVLFAGKSVPKEAIDVAPDNIALGYTENGWMTSKSFYEFITNVFYPWLEESNVEFPVILYIDGHRSHITLPLSQFCDEKKIILIALPPNATHIIQPLDVAYFRTFKIHWQQKFADFCKNFGVKGITKPQFALVLNQTLDAINTADVLKNGFRRCGLFPFNPDGIDYNKVFKRIQIHESTSTELEFMSDNSQSSNDLQCVEKLIGEERLLTFKSNVGPNWSGSKEYMALFDMWYKLANPTYTFEDLSAPENTDIHSNQIENPELESVDDRDDEAVPAFRPLNAPQVLEENNLSDTFQEDNGVISFDLNNSIQQESNIIIEEIFHEEELPSEVEISQEPNIGSIPNGNCDDELITFNALNSTNQAIIADTISLEESEIPDQFTKQSLDLTAEVEDSTIDLIEESFIFSVNESDILDQSSNSPDVPLGNADSIMLDISQSLNMNVVNDDLTKDSNNDSTNKINQHEKPPANPSVSGVSERLLKTLIWPEDNAHTTSKKRKSSKPSVSVISSAAWQQIQIEKDKEKKIKEQDIIDRKNERAKKLELDKIDKEKQKLARQEKKEKKERETLEKERLKFLKQQDKIAKLEAARLEKEKELSKKNEAAEIQSQISALELRQAELNEDHISNSN